jgi:hypothetical protein
MDLSTRNQRLVFGLIIVGFALSAIISAHNTKDSKKKSINWSFKGAVEKVHYSDKGIPDVTVNGNEYYLFYAVMDLDYRIQRGDTLIKQKGDLGVKVIRPHSRDTIYDRNPLYNPLYHKQD